MSLLLFLGLSLLPSEDFFAESVCIFWGCLFFHRMSFLMSPFVFFGVASFFIGGLF
jgi:hypothetical protein